MNNDITADVHSPEFSTRISTTPASPKRTEQAAVNQEPIIETAVCFRFKGRLLETVASNSGSEFIERTAGKKQRQIKHYDIGNRRLAPPPRGVLLQSRVILPSSPKQYGSVQDLDDSILAFVTRYVTLSKDVEPIIPVFVRATWLAERSRTAPILKLLGSAGSGKSRAAKVIGSICMKAYATNGSTTAAALMRTLDRLGVCTAILDEAEFDPSSDMHRAMRQALKIGFERDGAIERCTESKNLADKGQRVDSFAVFGPKIVAAINHDPDLALATRCIPVSMKEDRKAVIQLPESFEAERDHLQNQLLQWRLDTFFTPLPEVTRLNVRSRLMQLYWPLAVVATPEQLPVLDSLIMDMDEDLEQISAPEDKIAQWLLGHIGTEVETPISIRVIAMSLGLRLQAIGYALKNLGLATARLGKPKARYVTTAFAEIRALLEGQGYD